MTLLSMMNLRLCVAGAAALVAATAAGPDDATRGERTGPDRAAIAAALAAADVPHPVAADAASYGSRYRPWTPAWHDHCRSRYRSFDPVTGFYLSLDGERTFCRAEPNLARPGL